MSDETNKISPKKQRERSTAYPSSSLEEALELTRQLRDKLGIGPHKRSAAAVGIGYSGVSGASAAKIAAMTHFGLLDRTGDTYTISDIAKRILFPISDEDRMMAIIEAARKPQLYSQLLEKYAGERIPSMLQNILHITYGVSVSAAPNAADIFIKSMRFARLMDENDILSGNTQTISIEQVEKKSETAIPKKLSDTSSDKISIDSKCRVADGVGWRLTLESEFILNREIRMALVELEDMLEQLSNKNNNEKE